MRNDYEDDWLAQRINVLRPGWRGRLYLLPPEEAKGYGHEELIGTVVDTASLEPDDDAVEDPCVTVCANYQAGHFIALSEAPRFSVPVSRIAEMEAM